MTLDPKNVPAALVPLLPMAARWGVSDDGERAELIEQATDGELETLVRCIDGISDEALYGWLAGPEARNAKPTREYIAVTCLTMAIDLAKVEQKRRRRA